MTKKSVHVTGASPGKIGAALVLAFQQAGFTVFAAVRNPDRSADLAKLPDVHVATLDITSEESIFKLAQLVKVRTEGKGLDILMNSCRVEFIMAVVDCSLSEGKRLFDINVWGTFAMIKAFTPQLTENKGMVVNMSSIAGFMNTPWLGKTQPQHVLN